MPLKCQNLALNLAYPVPIFGEAIRYAKLNAHITLTTHLLNTKYFFVHSLCQRRHHIFKLTWFVLRIQC